MRTIDNVWLSGLFLHRNGVQGENAVDASNRSLLVVLLVGLVAGWLASKIVRFAQFRLIGYLVVGIVGAVIGNSLLPQLGVPPGSGPAISIVNATIGAVILLLLIRLVLNFRQVVAFGRERGWWS